MAVISFQQNKTHTGLFKQSKSNAFSFMVVLICSIVLIGVDAHYHRANVLRSLLSWVASPLQIASEYPYRSLSSLKTAFISKQALLVENAMLNQQHLALQEQLQHVDDMHAENKTLKRLISLADLSHYKSGAARVLDIDLSSARHVLVINKGSRDKVFVGQPVLDEHGLMGQVIDVGLITSTLMLISDRLSAVPIRNIRTQELSILVGRNQSNKLYMLHLPKTSQMLPGDLLVTSGLGKLYPEGYPVGRVDEVLSKPGEEFLTVRVSPLAALEHGRLVLLMWPNQRHVLLSYEVDKRLRLIRERSS